jgi:hypothetical protein
VICRMLQAFYNNLRPATIVIVGAKDKIFYLYSKCEFFKNHSFLKENQKIFKYCMVQFIVKAYGIPHRLIWHTFFVSVAL